MADYKPNSHKYKEEQKNASEKTIRKVGNGRAKKNELRKFTDIFISEDASNVKSYILTDVLVPAVKKLVSDIVRDGIDMILYGGSGSGKSRSSGSKISYRSYYDDKRDDRYRSSYSRTHTRFDYDDVDFESRGAAEAARTQMEEIIENYGFVTVADLYEMADLNAPFTSNKYGWMNIRSAEVVRSRDGRYLLKLPKASPID